MLSALTAPLAGAATRRGRARPLYFSLLGERGRKPGQIDELTASASRSFLGERLDVAAALGCDFPDDVRLLPAWLDSANAEAGRRYREYLDGRKRGAPRRFFTTRSHALHFLRSVAPTKLVDGAWLYGLVSRWGDPRLAALVRIYLQELGEGVAAKNHVVLYRQLLRQHGCEGDDRLPDGHFTQGALQLSLAHHAGEFLPEILGFNLGYEQLPLHLLVTAYELNELAIDPYYFTLHVTVDNASTGHARKAMEGVLDAWPRAADAGAFYRRLANGFKLNMLGVGTVEAIDSFDLDTELHEMLAGKAAVGAQLHSDYCRLAGKTVNEWLSEPGRLPEFLAALQAGGWIKRGQAAEESRFWRLLDDERAPMFGVFSKYEQQLVRDWIEHDPAAPSGGAGSGARPSQAVNRFRQRPSPAGSGTVSPPQSPRATTGLRALIAEQLRRSDGVEADALDPDLALLERQLSAAGDAGDAMALLAGFMSPANHHTPAGLLATRIFTRLFDRCA